MHNTHWTLSERGLVNWLLFVLSASYTICTYMLLIMCLCIVIHAHLIDYLPGGVLVHLHMHSAHGHQQVYHSFSSIYVLGGQDLARSIKQVSFQHISLSICVLAKLFYYSIYFHVCVLVCDYICALQFSSVHSTV